MADTGHEHPNYMAIFWYLAVLTVLEIGVVFLPHYVAGIGKMTVGVLLCGFALAKASLVAMYFMHLKFETRTLGLVAITPLALATLLVFVLLPDGLAVAHKTQREPGAVTAPVKHE
jgi:cytochrome c oxidase subunit IV